MGQDLELLPSKLSTSNNKAYYFRLFVVLVVYIDFVCLYNLRHRVAVKQALQYREKIINTLTDDTGRVVVAIGSEGSIARLQCQYPLLIANLSYNSEHGAWSDTCIIKELKDKGFKGIELENMKDLCLTWSTDKVCYSMSRGKSK